MSQLHYELERDKSGMPMRLVWSPEIQRQREGLFERLQRERDEAERQRTKPMAAYVDWAISRGIWREKS